MQFPTQFPFLVIPTGAGPGQQRITINFGNDGKIKVYDQNGNLVDAIGGPQGQIILYDAAGNMVVSLASTAGTDDRTGLPFQAGITTYTATTAINFFGNDGTWTASDGSKVVVETGAAAAIFFQPATLAGNVWDNGEIVADVAGGNHPELAIFSPAEQTTGTLANITLQGGSKASSATQIFYTADQHKFNTEVSVYNNGNFHTYTPTVTNGGTVTFSTQTGFYVQIGEMFYVTVYLVISGAGSGAGIVMLDMPTAVYRGTRQTLDMHCESVGPGGSHIGNGNCVFFTSGSGATSDRLRQSSNGATNADANITGADLLVGGIIVVEGWYRRS